MQHAGIGYPNGPVENATVFALPSPVLLMLAPEARYHHDKAVAAGKKVTWRSIPRIGKRPAELGWSPARFVAETINLTDAPTQPIADFVWANELDLQDERGDHEDDWAGLDRRYALIGGWAYSVVQMLRQWSPGTRIHWPAWTPDHDAKNYVSSWAPAANACDVVDFHAYDSLDRIETAYRNYRFMFPGKPLALTEWHCKGDLDEERRVLTWLAATMQADPLFDAAYFFIWRWWDHPGWWSDAWDIEHNPDRLALFNDPPTVHEPLPAPEVPFMTRAEVIALIVSKANQYGLVPWEFLGGAIAESALDPQAWRQGGWPDWSAGLFQQTVAFADEGDHTASEQNVALIKSLYFDPVHACDVAATKFTYWRYSPEVPALTAWCAYNLPASYHHPEQNPNIGNYRAGLAEAQRILGVEIPAGTRLYVPDVPSEVIRQLNNWSCAVRATYGGLWSMAQKGLIEPVSYGDEGPRDVYEWMVPEYDDPSVGLHLANGSGLVEMLARHGLIAGAESPTTLTSVQVRAGTQPVLLGGEAWNHWVLVNGLEPDGTLILENPSPGFGGIDDELRDSFSRLGPMTMVWIDPPAAPAPHPAPLPPDLARLQTLVGVAYHEDGTVLPALVAAAHQADPGQMRQQVEAVVSFLRSNNPDTAA